jgi:hypothetical protein
VRGIDVDVAGCVMLVQWMKLLAKEVARKPDREAWEARRLRQRS